MPKAMAPDVFASINNSNGIGESSSRSNDRPFFSKVTVTASSDVVPNRTEMPTMPGSRVERLSMPRPDLMKNMPAQASGNMSPQLTLGGLR